VWLTLTSNRSASLHLWLMCASMFFGLPGMPPDGTTLALKPCSTVGVVLGWVTPSHDDHPVHHRQGGASIGSPTGISALRREDSYCPSDQSWSDHRPVLALFEPGPDGQPSAGQRLLAQIRRVEAELGGLKALVEEMPQ
jgi:hypothetical protein